MHNTHILDSSSASSRLVLVDSLRGFALFGLFLVHCIEYFELYWKDPVPNAVHDVVFFLFAGKAYALFALLFGWSFHTLMDRQAGKGIDFGPRFIWRMVLLLGLGWLHGLLYAGDILQVLALLGLTLVFVNRLSRNGITAVSLFFLVNIPMLVRIVGILLHVGENHNPLHWSLGGQTAEVWAHGSLVDVLKINLWSGMLSKWDFFWASGRIFQLLGLFLCGIVLGRDGFFAHSEWITKSKWWVLCPVLIGSGLWWLQQQLANHPWDILQKEGLARYYVGNWLEGFFSLCILAIWILLFVFVWSTRVGQRGLMWLSSAGRMSLTIYIAQSIVCVPLFYGFGAGWYRFIGQEMSLLFGLFFFALQIAGAYWWMNRFYYGPLEWCWRAATYGTTKLPFKRLPSKNKDK